MRVSQFEISRLCQRALEGLGAPYGVDRDGAAAAVWLEARGLPGLALLAGDIGPLEKPGAFGGATPTAQGAVTRIDLEARPAIVLLGAAADFLQMQASRAPGRRAVLALENCRSPLFLLPAALAVAGQRQRFSLGWNGCVLSIAPGEIAIQLAVGHDFPAVFAEPGPFTVRFACAEGDLAATTKARPLDSALARAFERSLEQGVEVDDRIWAKLSAIAAQVQVPASEVSRRKGAGGGDANA